MRRSVGWTCCCVLAWSVVAEAQSVRPSAMPTEGEGLLADGLLHDARSLGHTRDGTVLARTGRMLALLHFARRLAPEDEQVHRQLVEIAEGSGDLARAADSAGKVVRAAGQDYAMAVRWVRLALSAADSADQCEEFLKGLVGDERLATPVRAVAWAELCRIYLRQSKLGAARQARDAALSLDPGEPAALQYAARLAEGGLSPERRFGDALKLLRGEPRGMDAAWRVGRLLQEAGLYEQAKPFYDHACAIAADRRPADADMARFLVDDVNLLMDSGQVEQGVAAAEEYLKKYPWSLGLRALAVEACRLQNQEDRAAAHIAAMEAIYKPLTSAARRTGAQAAEIGWFYFHYRQRAKEALPWAEEAERSAGDDVFVQEVLAAVRMAMRETDKSVRALEKLAERRPRSAAILARHYAADKDADKARQIVLKAAKYAPRTGQAWRDLKTVAKAVGAELPPPAHADRLREMLAGFEEDVLTLGRSPERFLRVTLTPAVETVRPGEAVAVKVELTNTSQRSVPLGPLGAFNPTISLSVSLEGDVQARLPDVTLAMLPAPKDLPAGQSVSRTIRVDLGAVEGLLAEHPLGEVKITVTGMVDPLEQDGKLFSSVPSVKVEPVSIRRLPLVDPSASDDEAQRALGFIVRDLKRGPLAEKLRAARQTASLLACVRRGETGRTMPPHATVITKPVLLSMTRAFLRAPEEAVRAEMIAALRHVRLDDQIIGLMAGNIEDPSGLVRMRLIELLAGQRTSGHQTLLDLYANDLDPQVREMTAAIKKAGKS